MELEYEISIKNKEIEYKIKEIERLTAEFSHPHHSAEITILEQENIRLRTDVERMKMKNQSIIL